MTLKERLRRKKQQSKSTPIANAKHHAQYYLGLVVGKKTMAKMILSKIDNYMNSEDIIKDIKDFCNFMLNDSIELELQAEQLFENKEVE
jgi:hypothetical protein